MRLVAIPPYRNPAVGWGWVLRHLVEDYRKTGALEGVEVDVDEGYLVDSTSEARDEEVLAVINVGIINKVKEYAQTGKYDAIVLTGGIDPGFVAARVVLQHKLPVTGAIHSALHVASLIGERVSEIHTVPSSSLIVRQLGQRYGFNDKLVSVRIPMHTSTEAFGFLLKYKDNWPQRLNDPGLKKIMDDITTECIAAVEENRADAVIFACEHLQACADGVRQRLDNAGYHEIPIIRALPAGLEMAMAMVNMKLLQTARAYPGHGLKAAPKYC
ncbi:MAG: aspartate/glutamate racemase family protein [Burkholderiales bacterium]|nr:aspartate/glutamate racemase family protein [Burkholderiales bacterium]